jgi:cellulose synthase/poly-beta-1,6-N-acetylglucosamine synthase-like glycosyltransferase
MAGGMLAYMPRVFAGLGERNARPTFGESRLMTIPSWLAIGLVGVNLVVLPYFLMMLATSLAAMLRRHGAAESGPPRSRFLVLIPAHDEEEGIAATVRSCLALDYPAELFKVLVIADNCTDQTALVARREGATVVERHDLTRKSKGHAIDFLIQQLRQTGELASYDALVIIDADSTASAGLLTGLARVIDAGNEWAQCYYTVANPESSWRTRLLTYAFSLFNGVTPLGQSLLGLSAGFRGNGMCFSTRGLERVPWQSHGLVEDMEYSWTVRIAGGKVAFLPDVEVRGLMLARGGKAAASQRQRWEHGRQELRRRMLLPLLRSPNLGWYQKLTSVLELTVPPLIVLVALFLALLLANSLLCLSASVSSMLQIFLVFSSVTMTLALFAHAISPFVVFRLPWNYLLLVLYVPFYAVWKFLVSLRGKPKGWVRTAREEVVNQ